MEDDRVKNEAMKILDMCQLLPRLIVFDLDHTLWPFYCDCQDIQSLNPHAKGILQALKDKGVDLAIASRSHTPHIANNFLQILGIKSMFVAQTGIPYNEMLFFDDEDRNIDAVSKMGVASYYVDNGVNLGALREGLSNFEQKRSAMGKKKSKDDVFFQKVQVI